ncbi:MAG: molybdopterin-binding protein [Flavobacteriales bacterium]
MNLFKGVIQSVETYKSLSLVKIEIQSIVVNTIVMETPKTVAYLEEGKEIHVMFKETEVLIGKGTEHTALSIQNRIEGKIVKIEKGKLLSKIALLTVIGELRAVITTQVLYQMELRIGEKVTAMIKTNEIMLS